MPSARRSASSPLHSAHTRPRRCSGPGCMHRIPKLLASNFEPDFDPCARPCPCGRQPKRSCEVCGGATASIICSAFGPAETFSPPQPVPCGPLRCRGAPSSICRPWFPRWFHSVQGLHPCSRLPNAAAARAHVPPFARAGASRRRGSLPSPPPRPRRARSTILRPLSARSPPLKPLAATRDETEMTNVKKRGSRNLLFS